MKNNLFDKIINTLKKPKKDVKIPELEQVLIQYFTWRKYIKFAKENQLPVDQEEWVLINNTYKVLRQEIKLRVSMMRRLVNENFEEMVLIPLLEAYKRRRENPELSQETNDAGNT